MRARQFDWDDHVFRSPAPRLADCRRLYLRDYEVHINIGAFEHEKRGEQRVVINIDLFVPLALSTPSTTGCMKSSTTI